MSAISLGDLVGDGRVDAELLLAHQGFAGQLQENALISGHAVASIADGARVRAPPRGVRL